MTIQTAGFREPNAFPGLTMRDTSVIQIDLAAVDHNMQILRRIVGPGVVLCPIVKADAYGLGAARLAKRLITGGAGMLAAYTPEQAVELVRAAVDAPILLLMPVWEIERTDELYRSLVAGRLHLSIHGMDHLRAVIHIAERFATVLPVHVEVDSGMSRGGVPAPEAAAVLRMVAENRWVRLAGLFTHFSNAEGDQSVTDGQMETFRGAVVQHKALIPSDCLIHAANTFATLRHARYHGRMVRIGLAWTGLGVESIQGGDIMLEAQELKPIVTWSSQVVHLKTIEPGTPVGYGSRFHAVRQTRIALVPVGYADGYPMACGEGVSTRRADDADDAASDQRHDMMVAVLVPSGSGGGWKRAFVPIIGAVNMDQITIDVTDLPEAAVGIGAAVELISPDAQAPNHLPRLAKRAGTIPHEILCRLNPRLRRVYLMRANAIETPAATSAPAGVAV